MKQFLLLFLIIPISLSAQYNFNKSYDAAVSHNGDILKLAWVGGFNNPQFSNIDIDQDGDNDLFVFDRSGDVLLLFKIDNSGDEVEYLAQTEGLDNFPNLRAWALLFDYNLDGKVDIFTHSDSIPGGGVSVYKNIGDPGNPVFELIHGLLTTHSEYETASFDSPLYVNLADIPSMIDVDEDGDMDILTFSINGSELEYHENQSQEIYNDNEHFEFELKNACWGYFKESSLDNSISLFDTCLTNVIDPKNAQALHVGSTVLGIDLDGDDVKDLLIGDITGNNLIALTNGGTLQSGSMIAFDNEFPSNTVNIELQVFPSAYYTDIDNDGLKELIVAPNAPNTANNFSSTWLYSNSGSNSSPVFNWEDFAFLQDEMIERGSNALPVLFDYNADGKKDLIIANKSFYDDNSQQRSSLALYENTGTNGNLSFDLVDDDYLALDDIGLTLALYPTFGDLDDDGDEDLIIGDLNGQLHYFENTAGAGNVANFTLSIPGISDSNGDLIDVGQFATPFIVDIDRDGKLDLIIGERSGVLNYYQNIGSSTDFSFSFINNTFGGIQMPGDLNEGFSVPFILDSDEGYQLFVGSNQGEVVHFFPIEDDLSGDFVVANENILPFREGKRTGVAIADIDNSDGLEMIVGNYRGGLAYYLQVDPLEVSEQTEMSSPFSVYPNPTNNYLFIESDAEYRFDLQLLNSLSQVLLEKKNVIGNQMINVQELPAGVYYLSTIINHQNFVQPVYIIK